MGKKKRSVQPVEERFDYSIGDPAFAEFLRMSGSAFAGGELAESAAFGLTAFYRAVSLISGTIAGLPLKVYEKVGDRREERDHFLSREPAGPYDMSAFAWTEMLMLHQLLHGECFLRNIATQGGEVVGLWPVHPLAVTKVEWSGADKLFTLALKGGATEIVESGELLHIPVMATDGLRGVSPVSVFRQALETAKQGERAANRTFVSGSLVSGLVTTEEDVDEEEAKAIKERLSSKMMGAEHAGDIAFVNRALKFSPWAMNNVDAQFLESRKFSVEEVARMFGLPTHLLSVAGAVSNWGTGVAEANLALQKYVLMGYTSRIESALRAILPPGWFAEFDYKGLLQSSPKDEIELLAVQVKAGLLTRNEARAIMNREPVTGGDVIDAQPNFDPNPGDQSNALQ
jgi:HK97 family phage portal protein